jgi:type II secretory pathway pseudopilin PulG
LKTLNRVSKVFLRTRCYKKRTSHVGMSMIETMFALAVMSIAGVSFVSMMTNNRKYQKSAESLSNRQMLFQTLQRAVLSPQNMRMSLSKFLPEDGGVNQMLAACVMYVQNDRDCIHGFSLGSTPILSKSQAQSVKLNGLWSIQLSGQAKKGIPGYSEFQLFGANGRVIAGNNVSYNLRYERCDRPADAECPIEAKVYMAPVCETGINIGDKCEIAESFRFLVSVGQRGDSNFLTRRVKEGKEQLVAHLYTEPSAPLSINLKDFKKSCGANDTNIVKYDILGNPVCKQSENGETPNPNPTTETGAVTKNCDSSEGKGTYTYENFGSAQIYAYDSDKKKESECKVTIKAKFCALSRFSCSDCDGTAFMRCSVKHIGTDTWEFFARSDDDDDKQEIKCSVACMN